MSNLSGLPERDNETSEEQIAKLVKHVRDTHDEKSFVKIKEYLNYYVKLFGKKYKIAGHDSDEIEQECVIALRFKAVEDFDPSRGKFRSFAILCIKRHLFSIIKGNHQQKRRVLNQSLSLDEDRSEDGESMSLASLIAEDGYTADRLYARNEALQQLTEKLVAELSVLEKAVFMLYLQQYHYDEMAEKLQEMFPNENYSKKSVDNSLVRIRNKSRNLTGADELFEDI